MRQFIYKMVIFAITIVLIYEFTIGKQVAQLKDKTNIFASKEGRREGVNKLRVEIQKAINKERYLSKEDAKLLSEFLEEENEKYEIRLADGFNFEAEKYFDITQNSWVLDNFSEKFAETYKRCKEKTILKDS